MKLSKTTLLNAIKKITIFDLLVILILAGGVVFATLFLLKQEKWIKVEVKISPKEWWWDSKLPPHWLTRSLKVGQMQYDALGRTQAKIIDIRDYEYNGARRLTYVMVNLKAEYDNRTKRYKFNQRPLEIGDPIDLSFDSLGTQGAITYIEGLPDPRTWEDIIVTMRVINLDSVFPETLGIQPWRAEAIHIGDEMKDSQGRVVATILEKTEKPADKIIATSYGNAVVVPDPLKKDVELKVKLRTSKQSTLNYFLEEFKIKAGVQIPLSLPSIDIWPEITKVVE